MSKGLLNCISLGCKVNQAEMAEIKGLDSRFRGNDKRDGNNNVRVCVLNTCAVTATAEAKSRKLIRRLIRQNPNSRLIVTGCLAQAKPDEVKQLLRKDDVVVGNKDKGRIPKLIGQFEIASPSPARTPKQSGGVGPGRGALGQCFTSLDAVPSGSWSLRSSHRGRIYSLRYPPEAPSRGGWDSKRLYSVGFTTVPKAPLASAGAGSGRGLTY